MKKFKVDEYSQILPLLYPEEGKGMAKTVTFQVTDACNLACKYCYQINKGHRKMSFEVAKKFIDLILSGEKGF